MMMSESVDKTASLAIVEKKPQRPGGCAGIFLQLFNWNRSFAKKKLFSNKLLPPAHPQQCAQKFGGDEKIPKHRLIANENCGGFPNMKKNGRSNNDSKQKPQMRPPSLVARLMGLDSMPAVQKNKPSKETSAFQTTTEEEEKEHEFTSVKSDFRPQKLQKTETCEKQALTKFTSDAFQFKSVLSRSKKHHRSKLVSPLKSPRTSSARTSSRLFDVATRMLEPGLQSTNKAKNTITYSRNAHNIIENQNDFVMERKMDTPVAPKSCLKAQSCKNCGSHIELNLEEKPQLFPNPHVEEFRKNPMKPPISSFEQEKWRISDKYQEISTPFMSQARTNKPQRDHSQSTSGLKHKIYRQSESSKVPHGSNMSKDIGSKKPMKINNVMRGDEIISCNKRGDSLSPVRKKRSVSSSQNGESSSFSRPKNARCNSTGERELKLDSRSFNSTKYKANNVKSFVFDSPVKQKMDRGITRDNACGSSFSVKSDVKANAEKLLELSGDELGALLQHKLRELSCQDDDEVARRVSEPKRTTAVILQELISALTSEKPMLDNDVDVASEDKVMYHGPRLSNKRYTFEAKQKTARKSLGYLHEGEHHSPGSILEASFSNDSCLSSSFGDGSVPNLAADSAEFYFDGLPKLEREPELIEFTPSSTKGHSNIQLLIDITSHVSDVLISFGFANTSLKRSNLDYAKEVILNTELVSKDTSKGLSFSHFLVYESETLASAMWMDFGNSLGFKDKRHENQFKKFVLDCVIEYLDTRYGRYSSCGFITWTKMPLCLSVNEFVTELVKEVDSWMGFDEYSLDEIIEFEMSYCNGKWSEFETEEYETNAEIGSDVLQILVDEIVVELFEGNMCSK